MVFAGDEAGLFGAPAGDEGTKAPIGSRSPAIAQNPHQFSIGTDRLCVGEKLGPQAVKQRQAFHERAAPVLEHPDGDGSANPPDEEDISSASSL